MTPDPRRARLEELLGIEATQKLTPAEANELDMLLAAFPDEDPDGFELAAAAVHLALSSEPEEMPAALTEKLHLAAVAFTPLAAFPKMAKPRTAWLMWTGWAIAATLALVLLYTQWPKPPEIKRELTIAEERKEFIEKAKPPVFADSKPGVIANVVWSNAEQKGYLEVRGLPPNDPTKEQYQLWIVDGSRTDPAHSQPVSGGVFNVPADGTTTVRIDPAVVVKDAKVFAVTKEPAGGVIVSKGPMLVVMTPKVE